MLGARVLVHEAAEEEEVAQRLRGAAVERDLARQRLAPGQLRARVRVRARGRVRARVRVRATSMRRCGLHSGKRRYTSACSG